MGNQCTYGSLYSYVCGTANVYEQGLLDLKFKVYSYSWNFINLYDCTYLLIRSHADCSSLRLLAAAAGLYL